MRTMVLVLSLKGLRMKTQHLASYLFPSVEPVTSAIKDGWILESDSRLVKPITVPHIWTLTLYEA